MLIKFDLKKLGSLLDDFFNVSGITISIWDAEYNELIFSPKQNTDFCRMVKETEKGRKLCRACDLELCKRSLVSGRPCRHYCHVGLIDIAMPIFYNDMLYGFMMFGQLTDSNNKDTAAKLIGECCKNLQLDEKAMFSAYDKLNSVYDEKLIESACNIVDVCVKNILFSDAIRLETNLQFSEIDEYISQNIDKKITVDGICEEFGISKNKLYQMSHLYCGCTFGNYVLQKRITAAKALLRDSDYLIYEISERVGIPDYNYFSKVFGKATGMTPLKFRKASQSPL